MTDFFKFIISNLFKNKYDTKSCTSVVRLTVQSNIRLFGKKGKVKEIDFINLDKDDAERIEELVKEARKEKNLEDDEDFLWWIGTTSDMKDLKFPTIMMKYLLDWELVEFEYPCNDMGYCLEEVGIHFHKSKKWCKPDKEDQC